MENWNKILLGEVLNYEQPTKYIVETTDYNDRYKTPVLTAGKSFILGYTNEKNGIFTDVPAIIFDDFTTAFHYVDFPFKVKSSAMKILKVDKKKADLRFLYYRMSKISLDTNLHKRYWISKFSKVQITIPSIDTQKDIAQILDNATSLRNKTEQLLKEYDVLAQSIFFDIFGDLINNQKGWDLANFENIFKSIIYGTSTPPMYQNEGIPFIRATNIKKGGVSEKGMTYISEEEAAKILKCKLSEGDLIIVRSGANTGDCGRIPHKYIDSFGGFDLIIKIDEPHSVFCNFLLNTKAAKAMLEPLTRRAGQPHLNSKQISKFQILNPPIELQNQFVEKLALIEKQKELAKQELKESEDLFNCLLQKAFKGELV